MEGEQWSLPKKKKKSALLCIIFFLDFCFFVFLPTHFLFCFSNVHANWSLISNDLFFISVSLRSNYSYSKCPAIAYPRACAAQNS